YTKLTQVIPHIFEAGDWDIYLGLSDTTLDITAQGAMASGNAAQQTAASLDNFLQQAAAQDPGMQQALDATTISANEHTFSYGTTVPKEQALAGMQMALGMMMMQM